MPRITNEVFKDLAIWMIGCGLGTGAVIPFFLALLGIPAEHSLHWSSFLGLTVSGVAVAGLNFLLVHKVVRPELRSLVRGMREVEDAFREATFTGLWSAEGAGAANLPVTSRDEIGETAQAFNELVAELVRVQSLESASSELSEALSSKLDLEELADQAIDLLLHHTDAVAGALVVEQDDALTVVANHGLSDPQRLLQSDHVLRALRTNQVQFVRISPDVLIEGVIGDFQPRQVLVFPVAFEQRSLGALVLASEALFGKDAMWLLRIFQQGMGLALNNALTHERLQQIAARDPLTGLYNRRFGMERLEHEFQQAVRHHTPLGAMIFDLDFFKHINDNHGHLAGDGVLKEIAALARKNFRDTDVLVRYGGEEFVVVMPGASEEVLRRTGERLRAAVEEHAFVHGEQRIPVTVSVGQAVFTPGLLAAEDLLRQADEALYASKGAGRNRVSIFLGGAFDLVGAGEPRTAVSLV